MAIEPLALKTVSMEQLLANNLLCNRHTQFSSQLHGQPLTLSLSPLVEAKQLEIAITLRIDGIDTQVQLSRSVFAGIKLGNTLMSDVLDQLPEDLMLGSMHLVFEHLLNDLRSLLQKDIQLLKVNFQSEPVLPAICVNFNVNEQNCTGLIGINQQNKKLLESLPQKESPTLSELPFFLTMEIGRTTLPINKIQNLHRQDILFFDHNWYKDREHVFIKTDGNNGFLARLNKQQITLENKMEAPPMNDDLDDFADMDDLTDDFEGMDETSDGVNKRAEDSAPAAEQQAPAQTDINAIAVQLTFDIGHQDIPMSEVAKLAPGYTFQLSRPISSPVIIKVNNKPFAEGELVDVNGQLGTRITRVL